MDSLEQKAECPVARPSETNPLLQAESYYQSSSCWGRHWRQQHNPFLQSVSLLIQWKLDFCCLFFLAILLRLPLVPVHTVCTPSATKKPLAVFWVLPKSTWTNPHLLKLKRCHWQSEWVYFKRDDVKLIFYTPWPWLVIEACPSKLFLHKRL